MKNKDLKNRVNDLLRQREVKFKKLLDRYGNNIPVNELKRRYSAGQHHDPIMERHFQITDKLKLVIQALRSEKITEGKAVELFSGILEELAVNGMTADPQYNPDRTFKRSKDCQHHSTCSFSGPCPASGKEGKDCIPF